MKMEATTRVPGGTEVRYAARSATQGDHVIRTIEAIPIRLPLTRPIKWAAGELHSIDNVIVIVTLANGVQGIADAPPRPSIYGETQASILAVVRDHLAPMLTGANAFDSWRLWNRMRSVAWNPCAKAALDMALHDAQAKSLGISCAELMGGTVRPLQVNWRLALGSVEVMLADADEKMQAHGFRAFKVKCGIDASKDIAMLTALRRHVGPEVELTVDMNQGYDLQTLSQSTRATTPARNSPLTACACLCQATTAASPWTTCATSLPLAPFARWSSSARAADTPNRVTFLVSRVHFTFPRTSARKPTCKSVVPPVATSLARSTRITRTRSAPIWTPPTRS
jgi:hypothetical protein